MEPTPTNPPPDPTQRLSEATVLNPSSSGGLTQPPPRTQTTTDAETPAEAAPAAAGPLNTPPPPSGGGTIPPTEAQTALPQNLGSRYRLIRVLGKGGFANVYLAHDSVLDQEVAVKILKLGLASKSDTERFMFEARVGAKLRHPNIATVFDILQTPEGLQMIMEYYPHGTLADRVKRKGAVRPREAVDIIRQVAQALSYAHRRNFVHRDVKPANIFLAGEGMIKLGDFGIAAHTELHEHTATGMVIGTPLYMAPEQASDSRSVDPRADLYALGLTLYYILTGKPPRILDLDLVPEPFRRLIKHSTEPDRTQRLVSCEQFIALLEQIEAGLSGRPATAEAGEVLPETVLENSRAPLAPDAASTEIPSDAVAATGTQTPATGAAFSPTQTALDAGQQTTGVATGSGTSLSQQSTLTQTAAAGGVPRYVWVLVVLIVLLSLPSIYIGWRMSFRVMDADPARLTPAALLPPQPGGVTAPAALPSVAQPEASPSPFAPIPTPVITPAEPTPLATTPTPTMEPTSTPGVPPPPAVAPTPAPTVALALPPQPTPGPPPGPQTIVEAMGTALQERPRIKRTSELLAAAEREPTMRSYNLKLARENMELELRERPEVALNYLILGVVLRREGRLPEARRAMGEGLRLNHQAERPLRLERPLLIQALGLKADEQNVLPPMPDRPPGRPLGNRQANAPQGQRPEAEGPPPVN